MAFSQEGLLGDFSGRIGIWLFACSQGQATLPLLPAKEGEQIRVKVAFIHLEGRILNPKSNSDSQWVEP
ncbi:MAG: hypothetical protein K0B37_16840 [Bacteroidales bacterium]|nr:hypothetical protein [Bacteroidales bacterium]